MLKNKPSAILFDLDGTIADSALDLAATLNHMLKNNGRAEIDPADVRNMVGEGAKALIIKGFSHSGDRPSDSEVDILFDQYLDYYQAHIADYTTIFPGAVEMLNALKDQDIPMAICTNKNDVLTRDLLEKLGIDHFFSAVTCGDSFPYKNPDPRHLFATCDLMKADPNGAIMVGDSINDIAAGRDAKMLTVGVSFGYTRIPVRELGPDIVIDHFDDFFAAVNDFNRSC